MSVIEWLLSNKLGYKFAINKVHEDGVRMMLHCVRLISLFHMDGHSISFIEGKMMHKRPVCFGSKHGSQVFCVDELTPITCHCKCVSNLLSSFALFVHYLKI